MYNGHPTVQPGETGGDLPGDTGAWNATLKALKAYADREGHARVPQLHQENGVLLGRWVNRQRELHAAGALRPDRVTALEAVRGWTWNAFAAMWLERYKILERYAARTGSAIVPRGHTEDGVALTGWIARQREAYREDRLTRDQVQLLEKLSGWSWGRTAARKTRLVALNGGAEPQPRPGRLAAAA